MWNMVNWLITQKIKALFGSEPIMHSQNEFPNFNSLQLTCIASLDSLCPHNLLIVCILQLQPAQQETFLRTRSTDMFLECMWPVPCPSKIRWGNLSVHHEEYLHIEATAQFTVENPLDMLVQWSISVIPSLRRRKMPWTWRQSRLKERPCLKK